MARNLSFGSDFVLLSGYLLGHWDVRCRYFLFLVSCISGLIHYARIANLSYNQLAYDRETAIAAGVAAGIDAAFQREHARRGEARSRHNATDGR